MAYLTCADLAVGYEGHAVCAGISFEVAAGDLLCVIGENAYAHLRDADFVAR